MTPEESVTLEPATSERLGRWLADRAGEHRAIGIISARPLLVAQPCDVRILDVEDALDISGLIPADYIDLVRGLAVGDEVEFDVWSRDRDGNLLADPASHSLRTQRVFAHVVGIHEGE